MRVFQFKVQSSKLRATKPRKIAKSRNGLPIRLLFRDLRLFRVFVPTLLGVRDVESRGLLDFEPRTFKRPQVPAPSPSSLFVARALSRRVAWVPLQHPRGPRADPRP